MYAYFINSDKHCVWLPREATMLRLLSSFNRDKPFQMVRESAFLYNLLPQIICVERLKNLDALSIKIF